MIHHRNCHKIPSDRVSGLTWGKVMDILFPDFQDTFLQVLRSSHADTVLTPLAQGKLDDDVCKEIEIVAADIAVQYKA